MRNNTKKGFTLVELLVVIAILAILATVSVVGYTSFIERANVSVDEQTVTQLNHFLEAYKVNNPEVIDDTNIRRITADILELAGITEGLEPKSTGRNFYFDKVNQEFVLKEDKEYTTSGLSMHFLIHAGDNTPKSDFLGSAFTDGNHFIVSTGGNALANVINAFYEIDNDKEITVETLRGYISDAAALTDYPEISAFVNSSAIIHQDKKYHVAEDNKYLIIPDNATQIGGTSILVNTGEEKEDIALVTPKEGETSAKVELPDHIEHIDASNSPVNGATNTIEFGMEGKTADEVANLFLPQNGVEVDVTHEDGDVLASVQVNLGDKVVTVETRVKTDENGVNVSINVIVDGDKEIEGKYENKLVGFGSQFASDKDKKVDSNYVVWDAGYFFVDLKDFVGEKGEGMPITNIGDVEWTVEDDFATVTSNGNDRYTVALNVDKFGELRAKNGVFTITAKIGDIKETFTVNTLYPTSVSYTLHGQNLTTDDSITLFYGDGDVFAYTLTQGTLQPNVDISNLNVEFTAIPAVNHNAFKIDENGKLTLKDENANGDHTVTIETGCYSYLNKTVEIELFNKNTLVFTQENENIVVVGDNNAITFGDLFKHNTNMEIPADAEIWITTNYGDTKFGDMDSVTKSTNAQTATFAIGGQSWDAIKTTQLQFISDANTANNFITEGEGANNTKVVVTVVAKDKDGNYVRIADNHKLIVVDATNIRSWDELKARISADNGGDTKSNTKKMQLKSNVVLISDIVMGTSWDPKKTAGFLDIISPSGASTTFHGNNFVFDIRSGRTTDDFVIRLQTRGVLDSVKIVGAVYNTVVYAPASSTAYGASAVQVLGSTTVRNCYIANTRTPLRVRGNTTIIDSVFFGGRYANIELANASTVELQGDIITINQPDKNNVVGLGIVVDMNANPTEDAIIKANNCNLVQYNFVPETLATNNLLPTITVKVSTKQGSVNLNSVFSNLISESEDGDDNDAQYAAITYKDGEVRYANAGIVYANTYTINDNGSLIQKIGGGKLENAPKDYGHISKTENKTSGTLSVDVTMDVYSPLKATYNEWFINRNAAMEQYSPENYCGVK